MFKNGLVVVIILFILFAMFNLTRQISESLKSGERLDKSADELALIQERNRDLKKKLTQQQTIDYLEEQARDKLNVSRPGETSIIITPSEIDQLIKSQTLPELPKPPHWQGWWKLFFD